MSGWWSRKRTGKIVKPLVPGPNKCILTRGNRAHYVTQQRGLKLKIKLRLVTKDLEMEAAWMAKQTLNNPNVPCKCS